MSSPSSSMMTIRFSLSLSILLYITLVATSTDGGAPHRCLEEERSALWEFKERFDPDSNSEIAFSSWNLAQGETGDCCRSWKGVECDRSGHVTALDLSGGSLTGSLSSNGSLFRRLPHLQNLNLAYNNFNYSQIPAEIGELRNLTSLNLTQSSFAGQVPSQILQLSGLTSLDLSENGFLELKKPDFESLVKSLPNLEHLNLNFIGDSGSTVPPILSSYSSLQTLQLQKCRLHGELPSGIFRLPNLQVLDLSYNTNLSYSLPDDIKSPLERLYLVGSNLSGKIPFSIGEVTNLTRLYLPYNNLVGEIPSSIANLTRLVILLLDENRLTGPIPPEIMALPELETLDLGMNRLTGPIPSLIAGESRLIELDLSSNELQGPVPDWIFELGNLESLNVQSNNLTGTVLLDKFLLMRSLTSLALSFNRLYLSVGTSVNLTRLGFQELFLASCNLTMFPEFLVSQRDLQALDLSSNNIRGPIPTWVMSGSFEYLQHMNLSNNMLTGFEVHPVAFSSTSLSTLDLSSNRLEGPLPIPPVSMQYYMVSGNNLTGNIPETICELTSLQALDLSFNNFTGIIPECLGRSLQILSLRRNSFHGSIPDDFTSECSLKMIDLSENKLQGKLPRSLANCTQLQFLSASRNKLNDTFPDWLGSLPQLSVLMLRANSFHGAIMQPEIDSALFRELCIIDISNNEFTGKLPSNYFKLWRSMEPMSHVREIWYMEQYLTGYSHAAQYFTFSLTMQNKGTETEYPKILNILVVVDFSSNRFQGEIPQVIGNLKGIHSLNLSNNALTGHIPGSLTDLEELESLDLSNNDLSGEIPRELARLSFLAVFNVSYNRLAGRVPRGQQFDKFQDSYYGNPGLCGDLLSRKCEIPDATLPDDAERIDQSLFEFDWKIVTAGYAGGLVVGLVGGSILICKEQCWFLRRILDR